MTAAKCQHGEHRVKAKVSYMEDSGRWVVDITLRCTQCDEAFRFLGLPAGSSFTHPTVSMDSTELRAPIEPEGTPELQSHASFEMPSVVGQHES